MLKFSTRELATVLAALRHWQSCCAHGDPATIWSNVPAPLYDHFDDDTLPLAAEDIDELCERLNTPPSGERTPADLAYIRTAKEQCSDDDLEVDDNAVVSRGEDPGAYVQAWIWVDNADAGICDECGEPNADNGEGWNGLCGDCADRRYAKEEEGP